MPSDLYDTDILVWSEQQAERLRRVARSERLNDEAPDWPNIIEEIESVGREQLHAVESLLVQAILHMLKADAWPHALAARTGRIWLARRGAAVSGGCRTRVQSVDALPPLPVPEKCGFTLEALLT